MDETKERYVITVDNAQSDKVLHDAPSEPVTVPGQTSVAGSTEAVNTDQEQTASKEHDVGNTRQNTQKVSSSIANLVLSVACLHDRLRRHIQNGVLLIFFILWNKSLEFLLV